MRHLELERFYVSILYSVNLNLLNRNCLAQDELFEGYTV
jgi:hypothetical protein